MPRLKCSALLRIIGLRYDKYIAEKTVCGVNYGHEVE
jgi:hypothetical protein